MGERRAKEQIAAPKLMGSLRDIVFSSEAVTRITERLAFDVIFVEGCDSSVADEEFYERRSPQTWISYVLSRRTKHLSVSSRRNSLLYSHNGNCKNSGTAEPAAAESIR